MGPTIYAIGDLHGHLELLERFMEQVKPELTRDRLVFMGDYIDRGPQSKGVVDYIIRLQNLAPPENIICLKGNHEAMFLDFLQGNEIALFLFNGGLSTIEDYWGRNWEKREDLVLPLDHQKFYQNLKLYYETPDYIFVHGGLKPGVPLTEQAEEDLLWIRGEFIVSREDFGRKVIFGHTPFKRPLVMPNKIGIDTGAVYGNFLTVLKLPQEEFILIDRVSDAMAPVYVDLVEEE
jgi:serine/threonine protein phosphatase 1